MEKVRRVLFVEDEPDIAEVVADALSSEGFEVCVAANGRDALELLHTGIPFDSVITDVSMPDGVSGIDVAHEPRGSILRRKSSSPPAISWGICRNCRNASSSFPSLTDWRDC